MVRWARSGVAVVVLLFLAGLVMLSGVASAHPTDVPPPAAYTVGQVKFAEDLRANPNVTAAEPRRFG